MRSFLAATIKQLPVKLKGRQRAAGGAPAAAEGAAAAAAADERLLQLRRFASHCEQLFPDLQLPEDIEQPSFDALAATLETQLGADMLGDLRVRSGCQGSVGGLCALI